MSEKVGIEKIGQIAVAVADIDRAVEFYGNILGLPLLFQAPPGLAFFDCGGTRLMLTTPQGEARDHHTSAIYYKVNDINRAAGALKSKGVSFIREPAMTARMEDHELWIGFIRDPDDNLVGLMAEIPFE